VKGIAKGGKPTGKEKAGAEIFNDFQNFLLYSSSSRINGKLGQYGTIHYAYDSTFSKSESDKVLRSPQVALAVAACIYFYQAFSQLIIAC